MIRGLSIPPLSCVITSVASPFTATGTRVTPQPRPEIGYLGSEPFPKPYPGPTGHSQAGPARPPDITATGIIITELWLQERWEPEQGSHFHHRVPGTVCVRWLNTGENGVHLGWYSANLITPNSSGVRHRPHPWRSGFGFRILDLSLGHNLTRLRNASLSFYRSCEGKG